MISESRFVESSKASTLNGSKGRRRCFSGGLTVPGHCSARTKPCGEEAIDEMGAAFSVQRLRCRWLNAALSEGFLPVTDVVLSPSVETLKFMQSNA
jgi:hypothetical protein